MIRTQKKILKLSASLLSLSRWVRIFVKLDKRIESDITIKTSKKGRRSMRESVPSNSDLKDSSMNKNNYQFPETLFREFY